MNICFFKLSGSPDVSRVPGYGYGFRFLWPISLQVLKRLLSLLVLFKLHTQKLQVDPDLMHSAGEWPTENDAGFAVEAETLELGPALLAVG